MKLSFQLAPFSLLISKHVIPETKCQTTRMTPHF